MELGDHIHLQFPRRTCVSDLTSFAHSSSGMGHYHFLQDAAKHHPSRNFQTLEQIEGPLVLALDTVSLKAEDELLFLTSAWSLLTNIMFDKRLMLTPLRTSIMCLDGSLFCTGILDLVHTVSLATVDYRLLFS